jgi:outer membrane protein assembly factor BamB
MIRRRVLPFAALTLLILLVWPGPTSALAASGDWPTYLHDTQRTAANLDETTLSDANAATMVKRWSFATGGAVASSATVVGGTAYFGSWDGYEYAVDAATGAQRWRTFLGTTSVAGCFPPAAGVTSTSAVVGGVVYVGGGDSYWYALDSATGVVLWKVFTGDNGAAGGHYNWSSPLIANGFAYIGVASFGDCPLVQGQLLQVNLSTHQVVNTFNSVPAGQVGGGIWTSPSLDPATNTIYVTTGTASAPNQVYAQAIIALDAGTLTVKSAWTIPAADAAFDSDWGTTPALLSDAAGNPLVVAANKNGYLYAFNRGNVGAGPLWRQFVAEGGDGTVSSSAIGSGTIFTAGGSTTIGGAGHAGYVRAVRPADGSVLWEHPDPSAVIAALAYANGLVFAGTGPTLEVLSAANGARLFSYTTGGAIYGAPTISNGIVYAGSVDGSLYAWSLPTSPPPPPPPDPTCPSGWTCQDIGAPQPQGSEAVNGGTWSVAAGGAGIGGTGDQFRAVTRTISGSSQVTATLTARSPASSAVAGAMVRQTASGDSPFYAALSTPGGLQVAYRSIVGGATTVVNTMPGAPPVSLEIQRTGDVFQAATSSDGVSYTLIPGSTVTLVLPTSVIEGVAVSSGVAGTTGTATFSGAAVGPAGAPPSPPPPTSPCPAGWNCADIGNPATLGGQSLSGATWTIQGAGADIWGTADQFHYVWQSLAGDGSVSARVASQTNTDTFAKAGVMLRQNGTDPGSVYYGLLVTPGNGLVVQYRPLEGLPTRRPVNSPGGTPAYLRVAVSGGTFTAYTSPDGTTWTLVVGSSVTLGVSGGMLAGLAVTSRNAGTASTVTFDSVTVVESVCPSGWSCADVGGAVPAGGQSLSGGTWTVQGGGSDIWGTSDQFHFIWQPLTGDGTVSAHVTSQTSTSTWAKAGVMLREDASPGASYYALEVTPSNGVVVQYRTPAGSSAGMIAAVAEAAPAYVQVARSGSTFTAYTSADGTTWTPVPGSSVTLGVGGGMLAGLAVTSHNAGTAGTVTFDSVAVATGAPAPPSVCPSGWSCADIGGPVPAGGQMLSGGTWTVQAGGADIWGTSDQFRFMWQPLVGDGTVTARVLSQTSTSTWAKAGVMLRTDSSAGSAYYAIEVTPNNGIVVQSRASAGASATTISSQSGTVPAYLRVARSGSTFTAYTSADGTTWTPVTGSSVTLSVSGGMLGGLAATSHNTATASTVAFDSVAVG